MTSDLLLLCVWSILFPVRTGTLHKIPREGKRKAFFWGDGRWGKFLEGTRRWGEPRKIFGKSFEARPDGARRGRSSERALRRGEVRCGKNFAAMASWGKSQPIKNEVWTKIARTTSHLCWHGSKNRVPLRFNSKYIACRFYAASTAARNTPEKKKGNWWVAYFEDGGRNAINAKNALLTRLEHLTIINELHQEKGGVGRSGAVGSYITATDVISINPRPYKECINGKIGPIISITSLRYSLGHTRSTKAL